MKFNNLDEVYRSTMVNIIINNGKCTGKDHICETESISSCPIWKYCGSFSETKEAALDYISQLNEKKEKEMVDKVVLEHVIVGKDKLQMEKIDELLKAGGFSLSHYMTGYIRRINSLKSVQSWGTRRDEAIEYLSAIQSVCDGVWIISGDLFLSEPQTLDRWVEQRPKISIRVEINGKLTDPKDISEETWANLRK